MVTKRNHKGIKTKTYKTYKRGFFRIFMGAGPGVVHGRSKFMNNKLDKFKNLK